jgi:hypothetical protein
MLHLEQVVEERGLLGWMFERLGPDPDKVLLRPPLRPLGPAATLPQQKLLKPMPRVGVAPGRSGVFVARLP